MSKNIKGIGDALTKYETKSLRKFGDFIWNLVPIMIGIVFCNF